MEQMEPRVGWYRPGATEGRRSVRAGRGLALVFRVPVPLCILEISLGVRYIDHYSWVPEQYRFASFLEAFHRIIFMELVLGGERGIQ